MVVKRFGRNSPGNNVGVNRSTHDDDDSSTDPEIPFAREVQSRSIAHIGSSSDSDSDSDSGSMPPLIPRTSGQAQTGHISSDSDSESSSDSGDMPRLIPRFARQAKKGDSNSDSDSDSSSDSSIDSGGMPHLVPRNEGNSSDSSVGSISPPQAQNNSRSNSSKKNNNNNNNSSSSSSSSSRKNSGNSNESNNITRGVLQNTGEDRRRRRVIPQEKKQPVFDIRGKLNGPPSTKKAIRGNPNRTPRAKKANATTIVATAGNAGEERNRGAAPGEEPFTNGEQHTASSRIVAWFRGAMLRHRFCTMRLGFVRFQALVRGVSTRGAHSPIRKHLVEFLRFYSLWGSCFKLIESVEKESPDWASLRDKQNYIRQQELLRDDEEDARQRTDEVLTSAMEDAMKVMEERAEQQRDDMEEFNLPDRKPATSFSGNTTAASGMDRTSLKRIHLSGDVVKWLRNGDSKYIDFFVRRMKQLSGGERSRILAKRLTGTNTKKMPIYETYLEQKSGFRILWTEKDDYMLVWYIAQHKRVSRLMRLIDDSQNRSERQRVSIRDIDEMKTDENNGANTKTRDEIFLDPLGNVPLKVYGIGTDEMEDIKKKDWTPALHLTKEERQVVETEGTVLLLGRSGTGKTVCICNRIEYDRQKHVEDSFSQLFIARSPRLCTYVKNNVGERDGSAFMTFDSVLLELERVLPKVDGIRDSFPDELMMKFSIFKRDIYSKNKDVDPLIVWTNIRSFIKGSMEAVRSAATSKGKDFFVSQEEYLSTDNFGEKRCRLSTTARRSVYNIFLKYKEKMEQTNAWDSCDRIVALNQRLLAAKKSNLELSEELKSWCEWSKIYVDEVQDYTQVEILLFFRLSGAGNLFLAGDPAQNVTKGVEFRFDDIRSVGYHIAKQMDRRLIPQKPKIVNVNFRSHAGILNAAAAILSRMFKYFPDSATQLEKDDGLFQGPRPGIFHLAEPETMTYLVSEKMKGTVILTHDEKVDEVIEKLDGYELVYGIRRAKGLEFKSVIIMDFFSSLPSDLQKPWRDLLLNRDDKDYKNKYPEVEGHLKLFYTAVTRCIDRLFFAETERSESGDAFLRFMTKTDSVIRDSSSSSSSSLSLATKNKIGKNIESMTMTQDEWLASGIMNAEAADAQIGSDIEHAKSLIEKAIYCFQQAENDSFENKARIQLESFALRNRIFNTNRLGGKPSLESDKLSTLESDAAILVEKLLKENLLLEAKGLGRDVKTVLRESSQSSSLLERYILQHL